jgi:hypothetical protein
MGSIGSAWDSVVDNASVAVLVGFGPLAVVGIPVDIAVVIDSLLEGWVPSRAATGCWNVPTARRRQTDCDEITVGVGTAGPGVLADCA